MPNKFLGQHFLKSETAVKKIVATIDPQKGEVVIEIGPGHGELTHSLAEACKKSGAKLVTIEKDPALAETLKEGFKNTGVTMIQGDALKLLAAGSSMLDLSGNPVKLVGNIPYYLTGRLLRIASELPQRPIRCVFMVQQEVAERAMAVPPDMNRLAASIQFWAKPKIIVRVPKEDFDPMPEVDSVVLSLGLIRGTKTENADASRGYYAAMHALFAQPRKTILNNLAAKMEKAEAEGLLRAQGIDPGLRPQDLSVESIERIGDNFRT